MGEWIRISSVRPDDNVEVLFYSAYTDEMSIGYLSEAEADFTHWQHKPLPPAEASVYKRLREKEMARRAQSALEDERARFQQAAADAMELPMVCGHPYKYLKVEGLFDYCSVCGPLEIAAANGR